jgi:3-methyl-2-oxobutanoate hydroxymethyltransferase
MSEQKEVKRITTNTIQEMKQKGEKIAMLTSYDYSMASIVDEGGVDVILVGDSASNVMAGHETTLPITLDQMIYHAQSVVRAVKRALVVVDLPFGSYQGNSKEALNSAVRIMKESGAHAVKLEGGLEIRESIERIITAGIPVMGHLGLTPQSIYKFGTYTVRAKEKAEAEKLKQDIIILQDAGCFSVVLEKIPAKLAQEVSKSVKIPTIGIGAGPHCDGQVLVINDMIGLTKGFKPRFLRQYLNLFDQINGAVQTYVKDVKSGVWHMTATVAFNHGILNYFEGTKSNDYLILGIDFHEPEWPKFQNSNLVDMFRRHYVELSNLVLFK